METCLHSPSYRPTHLLFISKVLWSDGFEFRTFYALNILGRSLVDLSLESFFFLTTPLEHIHFHIIGY